MRRLAAWVITALLLAGCGNKPRVPDWQMNAHDGLERYVNAYLGGKARVESSEFERARDALEATGQPGLVARAELTRCAVRVASLEASVAADMVTRGLTIEQARTALLAALDRLRPADTFNILTFNESVREFRPAFLPADGRDLDRSGDVADPV